MQRWVIVGIASMVLMGCEVMDDLAWTDNTYLAKSESQDGWLKETYITDTYSNMNGTHNGIAYNFYVTNNRSQPLCFKLEFSSVRADRHSHSTVYRIEAGQKSLVAWASIFSSSGGDKAINVRERENWAWIDSWEDCQRNVTW